MIRPSSSRHAWAAIALVVAAVALLSTLVRDDRAVDVHPSPAPISAPAPASPPGAAAPSQDATLDNRALLAAERGRRSDVLLAVRAPVVRVLKDDREGDPHQRFVVRADGITVLVAHNLDLASRVPLAVGDTVVVRGEYEWNPEGGVLHWTHDDPRGRHGGGYVELDGRRYE